MAQVKSDPFLQRARQLAIEDGIDPDSRITKEGSDRGMPAWCQYRGKAREEYVLKEQEKLVNTTSQTVQRLKGR